MIRHQILAKPRELIGRWTATKGQNPLSNVGSQVRVTRRSEGPEEKSTRTSTAGTHDIKAILEQDREVISSEITRLTLEIRESACRMDKQNAKIAFESLVKMANALRLIDEAAALLTTDSSLPAYQVSSWFLHDCNKYLMKCPVEALHFVTGMEIDGGFTLDKMIEVAMSRQTPVSAVGDVSSTHRALLEMESYGHRLVACFHSHPGCGPGATTPSATDIDYQARQEKGGYIAIGGIFSRDGYFRAFSLDLPFRIEIYGKGVQKIDERLFRLHEID